MKSLFIEVKDEKKTIKTSEGHLDEQPLLIYQIQLLSYCFENSRKVMKSLHMTFASHK